MSRVKILCLLGFILLFSTIGASWAVAQELQTVSHGGETVEVNSLITAIGVRGNALVTDKTILDAVFSRVGDSISQEKLRGDLKAIHDLGYFSDVSVSFEAFHEGTMVVFVVIENPLVNKIMVTGNTVYSTAEILSWLKTRIGKTLNYQDMQTDIDTINNRYKTDGYILARVADVDTDEKKGWLNFKIIEGRVDSITLDGNDNTHDDIILREFRTHPGSVLNENMLKSDLRRVFNLGFFSEVTPGFEPGASPESVSINLKIKENRSSTVNFGGGYGEREGWFGFVDLSVNNLLGTGQGLMIRGQSGQSLGTYQFRYTNPWFWPAKLGDHAALTFRRWLTVGQDVYLIDQDSVYNGFDVSIGKPITDYFNVAWTIGSELVYPHTTTATFEGYQANTIGLTLAYDTRDFWLNPTEGRYYSLALKQGWKHSSNPMVAAFSKVGLDLNHYKSMFGTQVLAMHVGIGTGLGDVPIGEYYWVGSANTVRGYQPSEARKGTQKFIFNAEYRWNVSDVFQAVFFYDFGNAWSTNPPIFNDFLSGWGPGVRLTTPLGPIRLDWGVPKGKTFGEGVMHFSIGQAF
jgi:outer membrane protein insertion porin family